MRNRAVRGSTFLLLSTLLAEPAVAQHIIAHRGASFDAPENTLSAFRLAWEQGADGVEADFYLSADGQVVCFHDNDTERVCGVKHIVEDTTWEVLKTLDVGAWKDPRYAGERMPLMADVLATVPPGKMIFIELKTGPEIVAPMAEILRASRLKLGQIVIISFDADAIAACKERLPGIKSHWLSSYKEQDDGTLKPTADEVIATLNRTGADGYGSNGKLEVFDADFLDRLRKAGHDEFHVWTINDADVARTYQRLGAWSITTDRPGWLRERLRE
jgi:glycerophosphoryl diester phosphodiesterase